MYSCDICSKSFMQQSNLNYHFKTHSGNKSYKCDIYYKSFTQQSRLKIHLKTHTEDKSYSCDICCKSFKQKSSLIRHLKKIHSGEKEYLIDPNCLNVCMELGFLTQNTDTMR